MIIVVLNVYITESNLYSKIDIMVQLETSQIAVETCDYLFDHSDSPVLLWTMLSWSL